MTVDVVLVGRSLNIRGKTRNRSISRGLFSGSDSFTAGRLLKMHRSIIERFVNNQSVLASVRPKAIDAPTVVINISVIIITTHTLCIRRVCVCVSVCQLLIFGHSGQSTAAPSGGPGRGKERKKKLFIRKCEESRLLLLLLLLLCHLSH